MRMYLYNKTLNIIKYRIPLIDLIIPPRIKMEKIIITHLILKISFSPKTLSRQEVILLSIESLFLLFLSIFADVIDQNCNII